MCTHTHIHTSAMHPLQPTDPLALSTDPNRPKARIIFAGHTVEIMSGYPLLDMLGRTPAEAFV